MLWPQQDILISFSVCRYGRSFLISRFSSRRNCQTQGSANMKETQKVCTLSGLTKNNLQLPLKTFYGRIKNVLMEKKYEFS
jgi:uncharacterized radical SAM superfamily protein